MSVTIRFLPGILKQFNCHQSVIHGFVNQCVDTGHKEVNCTKQSLSILTQELLCLSIEPKLILKKEEFRSSLT